MRSNVFIALGIAAVAGAIATLSAPASAVTLPKAAVTAGYDDLAPFSQRLDIVLSSASATAPSPCRPACAW